MIDVAVLAFDYIIRFAVREGRVCSGGGDCVSRRAIIGKCEDTAKATSESGEINTGFIMALDFIADYAKHLPSVEPERKTGKIICSNEEIKYGNIIGHVLRCKCSECNFVIDRYVAKFINYCPNCGAKIEV